MPEDLTPEAALPNRIPGRQEERYPRQHENRDPRDWRYPEADLQHNIVIPEIDPFDDGQPPEQEDEIDPFDDGQPSEQEDVPQNQSPDHGAFNEEIHPQEQIAEEPVQEEVILSQQTRNFLNIK